MQLTVWTYEGPPHVGAMRVVTAMRGVHYVLHAPQGDTYADLLFTMIERRKTRPPVTYTTFQARDLGKDTAEIFKRSAREAYDRFQPDLVLVGASCTAELIQDDPSGIGQTIGIPVPVVPVEFSAYQHKENHGASETLYRLVRACTQGVAKPTERKPGPPRANLLGPTALGFRHRDDVVEITKLLGQLGVTVNVVAPLGASPADLARLPDADFNVVLYREIGESTARYLTKTFGTPAVTTVPIGVGATREFVKEVAALVGVDPTAVLAEATSRLPWYTRSVDSTYLTGKRVFVFGDGTHVLAAARIATEELGFTVVGLGSYSRELARDLRAAAAKYGVEALISDDHLEVEETIARLQPELVLGTQMERHTAKRLGLPCAVISAPVHVQDYPARYSPQMGFEGANVIFDTWVHPLMMGLEEHLLSMFREDFEFSAGAAPSHLGSHAVKEVDVPVAASLNASQVPAQQPNVASAHVGSAQTAQAHVASAQASQAHVASAQASQAHVASAQASQAHVASEPSSAHAESAHLASASHAESASARLLSPTLSSAGGEGDKRQVDQTVKPAGAVVTSWTAEAEKELKKIPFFVRGKAKRNTERFAQERNIAQITLETLYDAKAHFRS